MYLDFFKFHQKPFQINTDPRLHWFGKNNTDAYKLFTSVLNDKGGISVLTGDSGTGKTMFINLLLGTLPDNYITGVTHDPSFNDFDFSRYLADVFGLQNDFDDLEAFFSLFSEFLQNAGSTGKSVVLVVDEAQKLSQKTLNMIVQLSELKNQEYPVMSVILCGQNDLLSLLTKSKNTKLKRIINAKHQLQFLSEEETRDYIEFRLYASGIRENIFTIGAIQKIFRLSKGSPHKINTIADYALLSGYITGTRHINETLVEGFTDGFDQMLSEMTNSSLPFDDKQLFFEQEPPEAPCKTPINPASHNVFRFHSQDLRVLKQMARFYIENKNLAEAELYIEKIVQSNEMITDTTMMKGEIHLLRTEFDAAIDTFNQILAKEPMNVHSYYFKALAHIEKGDIDIAKASLGTALSINPKFNKGKSLLQKIRQECQDYQ